VNLFIDWLEIEQDFGVEIPEELLLSIYGQYLMVVTEGGVGAGFFDGFFRCPAECMAVGSGVAEGFGQIGNHFFGNAFVNGGGGGVVEINGGFDGHGLLFLFL